MQSKYINILGEEYKINTKVLTEEDEYLNEVCGYCDSSTKEIIVAEFKNDIGALRNLKTFEDKVIRHEIIHAFLDESGLKECSEWARNEEMVDFFANQIPKMVKVFKELEII